jgi:hypothetical protein
MICYHSVHHYNKLINRSPLDPLQIGRETARLASSFGVNIIAANSTGQASVDNGVGPCWASSVLYTYFQTCEQYIFAGTGDPKGILPTAWYSTRDQKSFHKFLSQTDILIASLPSTKDTKGMLTSERMGESTCSGASVNALAAEMKLVNSKPCYQKTRSSSMLDVGISLLLVRETRCHFEERTNSG